MERGVIQPTETTVLVLTGSGLKTTRRIGELMGATRQNNNVGG